MRLRKHDLFGYALVTPAMLLVLGFVVYPVVEVIRLSFTNTSLLVGRSDFVGLQSYQRILADPLIDLVVRNTATWVFLGTALTVLLGLGVGYFLSFNYSINRLLRASILIPWLLPAVVSVAAWRWMYSAEEGVINDLLKRSGRGAKSGDPTPGTLRAAAERFRRARGLAVPDPVPSRSQPPARAPRSGDDDDDFSQMRIMQRDR